MAARAGKGSRVQADGTNLDGPSQWSATERGDDLDTTNFESFDAATGKSFETGLIGVQVVESSFGGNFNPDQDPRSDPPGIFVREDLPDLNYYLNSVDGSNVSQPLARIIACTVRTDVRGKVEYEAGQVKSNGTYSWEG